MAEESKAPAQQPCPKQEGARAAWDEAAPGNGALLQGLLADVEGHLFCDKKGRPHEMPRPLAPLADSHGHLTQFETQSAAQALCRAALAGARMLVVPVDPSDDVPDVAAFLSWFQQSIEEARGLLDACARRGFAPPRFSDYSDVPDLLDDVWLIAGVHPYGAARLRDDPAIWERLEALLDDPRCIGIGEIGCDLGPYNELPLDVQLSQLKRQLRLAQERGLPVELHVRDARDDLQALAHQACAQALQEEGMPAAGCDLHCFTSSREVMKPFVQMGCHIAFGGAATFKRSEDIRAALATCPQDLILSETDCPYMAPVPLRGRECEPAMVGFSAACIAEVREQAQGIPREKSYRALWSNVRSLFGLDKNRI